MANQIHKLNLPRDRQLVLDEPVIMGILNVTPDSFSDGGLHAEPNLAVNFALQMIHEGARMIDVGGESTRPGSQRVSAVMQIARIVPVIKQLRQANSDIVISIDTTLSNVAQAALDAGADIINDISAGEEDPQIFELAAKRNVPLILMHKQGMPVSMQDQPCYDDVVAQVHDYLLDRIGIAQEAGVDKSQIVLDPGIGFGKTIEHNMALIASLNQLVSTGYPVLLGASRKSLLRSLCTMETQPAPEPHQLIGATCATTALGVQAGVHIFRVHDVHDNWQAMKIAKTIPPRKLPL